MKTETNPPAQSKINYTVLIQSLMNVLIYWASDRGIIPPDAVVDALVAGNIAAAAIIGVFRTWFTNP